MFHGVVIFSTKGHRSLASYLGGGGQYNIYIILEMF